MKLLVTALLISSLASVNTKRRDPDYDDSYYDDSDYDEEYDYDYYEASYSDSYYDDSEYDEVYNYDYYAESCNYGNYVESSCESLKAAYQEKCETLNLQPPPNLYQHFTCVVPEGGLVIRRDKKFNNDPAYFDKYLKDYEAGFGSCDQEFFIGLAELHRLTSKDKWVLTVELGDGTGSKYTVKYHQFSVGPAPRYQLTVGGFQEISPGMGDSLAYYNNNMAFTTKDQDLDQSSGNCAVLYAPGGWWHNDCYRANFFAPFRNQQYYGVSWFNSQIPGRAGWDFQWPEGAWYLNKA